MNKKEETIYCGSGKVMNAKWLKVTINPTKIADYIQEYNGNKFIKLNINLKYTFFQPEKNKFDAKRIINTIIKPAIAILPFQISA